MLNRCLRVVDALSNSYNPGQPRDSLGKWVDENGGGLSIQDNIARGNNAFCAARSVAASEESLLQYF
jgi:hypothetical protein